MEEMKVHRVCVLALLFVLTAGSVEAQQRRGSATRPTTDPNEARAINAIFERWGIRAGEGWNISGELCSGIAIDNVTRLELFSPGIKCDCSYNGNTTCHIYSLRVFSMSDWDPSSNVVGPLPDELWSLIYLNSLTLAQNYLTGPLPSAIGNLTRLQYLSLSINALSGELPKELGKLTDLRSLAISTNNFSGSLPPELGNCRRLIQLYIDSSGLSGAIPLTFANLRNLDTVFASDNAFTGWIPDFIGRWSKLITLRLEGNSLEGPIPSTFSNLTTLTELRISDLSNGSSSLDFLTNMKSLTTLILRNNNISGSIPSNLNEYPSLSLVDLSFNRFTGQIPNSLFNTSSLIHLFLGSNRLTGSLPEQKSPALQYIDLSYNDLSGIIPSWAYEQNLQLNLVANNFVVGNSNGAWLLPLRLNCQQRNFPCNRGQPRYSSFAIKSGGPQIKSATGIVYEADNETLGPSVSYVNMERRWAVSNVGLPASSPNPEYRTSYLTYIPNTRNPELYQSSRLSASSLRYYGLGLENGGYNVTLQFVETKIENPTSWKSLGRRIFDIYIQGNLAVKDFDIRKEAGGASFRAVVKEFTARVTENHLEIHLFWAGKGTCCVPNHGTYGPSISAISVTPGDFIPTVGNNPENVPVNKKTRTGVIVGIVVSVAVVSFLSVFAIYYRLWRRKRQKRYEDEDFLGIEARPYTFGYEELRAATDGFSTANKLGEGGFGPVYKGMLEDGRIVAVKQLSVASHQGKSQFVAEIATISAVQHRNLVKLYGCCIEGDKRLLVYEYLENKSLDQALFGDRNLCLDWPTRVNICLGVARGLAYLHEESRLRIVHRDVKASNILLDSQLNPKISDFGLAKLYDDKKTHISTRVAGTIGYLAPEYAMRGHLTEKADVFGFGVVALEIISGRANSDPSLEADRIYLLEWAWNCQESRREMELVDDQLSEFKEDEVRRVIGVALLCSQMSPALRPSMSRVVAMLSGDTEVRTVMSRPGYLTEWNFDDTSTFQMDTDDQTSSMSTTDITPYSSPVHASLSMLRGASKR